jgi:hypothetical protein
MRRQDSWDFLLRISTFTRGQLRAGLWGFPLTVVLLGGEAVTDGGGGIDGSVREWTLGGRVRGTVERMRVLVTASGGDPGDLLVVFDLSGHVSGVPVGFGRVG